MEQARQPRDAVDQTTGPATLKVAAIAKALTSLDRDGLAPLEAAGLRFSAVQKAVLKDMVETGRAAEAQQEALALVQAQVGGSGAAAKGTLTGAYTALSDALQRGSEQGGTLSIIVCLAILFRVE